MGESEKSEEERLERYAEDGTERTPRLLTPEGESDEERAERHASMGDAAAGAVYNASIAVYLRELLHFRLRDFVLLADVAESLVCRSKSHGERLVVLTTDRVRYKRATRKRLAAFSPKELVAITEASERWRYSSVDFRRDCDRKRKDPKYRVTRARAFGDGIGEELPDESWWTDEYGEIHNVGADARGWTVGRLLAHLELRLEASGGGDGHFLDFSLLRSRGEVDAANEALEAEGIEA